MYPDWEAGYNRRSLCAGVLVSAVKVHRLKLIILFLLGLSAFIVYRNLPNYLTGAIARQLSAYGFEDVKYNSSFPRLDGLDVRAIEFSYHSAGAQLSGEIESLAITYDVSGLSERRVDVVGIKNATLTVTTTAVVEKTGNPTSASEGPDTLPFRELNLENVRVVLPDKFGEIVLNGHFITDQLLSGKISVDKPTGEKLLNGDLSYELDTGTARATLRLLPAGLPFPLTELSGTLSYRDGVMSIEKGKAKVFSGEVTTKHSKVVFKEKSWSIPLKVQGINLEQLLKDYPQEKVSGTGILDGEFILSHDSRGFSIQKGQTAAQAPGGTIRYLGAELDTAQSGLPGELQVLKNFNYETLKAPFSLEPDGTLRLNLELSGNSPDWQSGKRVNLNLNIEENLYDLIESIRLTQGQGLDTEEIEKAIKSRSDKPRKPPA